MPEQWQSPKQNLTHDKRIVQALVSQGISIALGSAFTTQPADQHFVSPQSRGSNLRDLPNPCGNLTYRMMYSFYPIIVVQETRYVKKKYPAFTYVSCVIILN